LTTRYLPISIYEIYSLDQKRQKPRTGDTGLLGFLVGTSDGEGEKVRDALLVLASALQDFKGAFGKKGGVDPVRSVRRAQE